MKTITLASGDAVPAIGLGTWKISEDEAFGVVQTAIESGYRHIDCARIYENEVPIGRGLEFCLRSGVIDRDSLWITSKLWNDSHRRQDVRPALEQSLLDLRLDWLDLYLIHWPVAHRRGVLHAETASDYETLEDIPLSETWLAMRECQKSGLCRNIGVSNFSRAAIEELISQTGIVPAVNQVEMHPYLPQNALLEYCHGKGIAVTAYSPLGSRDRPEDMKSAREPSLFRDPVIESHAQAIGISPASLLIAWAVQRGTIVIPKSANPQRIRENLAAAEISIPASVMQEIAGLDRHFRFVDGKFWEIDGGPYTAREMWGE
jgi:alcohol dehydrogenase (NADP+)